MYYPGPLHEISSQSGHNFLSNVFHRQTDRQTNRQTNVTKNITSFAKEVIIRTHICLIMYTASFIFDYYCRNNDLSCIRGIGVQPTFPLERVWIIIWVFSGPKDGSPSTRDLHVEYDPNCLSARPLLSRATIDILAAMVAYVEPSTGGGGTSLFFSQ